jgi:hypothetical protein
MKKLKIVSVIALLYSMTASAAMCFLENETTSGMNKICYYSCLSGTKTITIAAMQFCPLDIDG